MAYHYRELGHTKIEIGNIYSRSLGYYCYRFKLKRYNPTTGICVVVPDTEWASSVLYLTISELSNWHYVGKGHQ